MPEPGLKGKSAGTQSNAFLVTVVAEIFKSERTISPAVSEDLMLVEHKLFFPSIVLIMKLKSERQ